MAGPRTQNPTTKTNRPTNMNRLIALVCLALIMIVGLAILVTWLVIKPKEIQYSVDEGWIRDYNLTNDRLTSTFNFVIRTYNPNKKASLYYKSMEVTVSYRGQKVATNVVQPFFQPHNNVTRLMFQDTAHNVTLPAKVVHDLKVERTGGEVDLDIKIRARIRIKVGIWKSRHYKLKALCSPVVVSFSNDKRFQKTDCDVDV